MMSQDSGLNNEHVAGGTPDDHAEPLTMEEMNETIRRLERRVEELTDAAGSALEWFNVNLGFVEEATGDTFGGNSVMAHLEAALEE